MVNRLLLGIPCSILITMEKHQVFKVCNYNFVGSPPKYDRFGMRNGNYQAWEFTNAESKICMPGNSQMLKVKYMCKGIH